MNSQKGAVLVEAAIYFPLVLCVVVAMLYLGLFHMQESALGHIAESAVLEAAREEAYPGYSVFGMNSGNDTDFGWSGNAPSKSEVESYYRSQHGSLGDLYREVGQIFSSILATGDARILTIRPNMPPRQPALRCSAPARFRTRRSRWRTAFFPLP